MNNTDKLKKLKSTIYLATDSPVADSIVKIIQGAEIEIAELTKQRDELQRQLAQTYYSCRVVYKSGLHSDDKEAGESFRNARDAMEALSTQEANKDEDGPLCDHGVKYHECKYNCIQF